MAGPAAHTAALPELRYRAWWTAIGWGLLLGILVLALLPLDDLNAPIPVSDKIQHAVAFFALMIWFCGLLSPERYWRAFAGLMGYGLVMEGLQWLSGYRYLEVADLAADTIGLAAGWLAARAGLGRWPAWLERRLGVS